MSLLVGCPGPGGFLSGGAFVRLISLLPGGLFPWGSFARGDFWLGGFLSGGAFVRGGLLSGGLMPVLPKFNAYTHRLGFCA